MKYIKDQIYNYHDYQSQIQDFLRFFLSFWLTSWFSVDLNAHARPVVIFSDNKPDKHGQNWFTEVRF